MSQLTGTGRLSARLFSSGLRSISTTVEKTSPILPELKSNDQLDSITLAVENPSPIFPARSWLFAAKTNDQLVKAAQSKADVIVLDMEDAVPMHKKDLMRKRYRSAIETGIFNGRKVFVRVNDAKEDEQEMMKDIETLTIPGVCGFLIPKSSDTGSLEKIAELTLKHEHENGLPQGTIKFVPIIESAIGYLNASNIASASTRNVALIVGTDDFSSDCGILDDDSPTADALLSQVVIAARAAKLEPIAGATVKFDPISSEIFYRKMKSCGFSGAAALNLTQYVQANREFSYTSKELQWAKTILSNTDISMYQASVQDIPQMIGPPHQIKALTMVNRQGIIDKEDVREDKASSTMIHGRRPVHGLHSNVTIGKLHHAKIDVTVTESWKTLWESSFRTLNNIATSDIFASKLGLGLRSSQIPFAFLNTLTLSLTVSIFSESARVHLGCYNALQHHPVYPGDTLTAVYQVKSARHKKVNDITHYTVVESCHGLLNQDGEVVFTVNKRTMFPPLQVTEDEHAPLNSMLNFKHSQWKEAVMAGAPYPQLLKNSQPNIETGELMLHNDHKVFGKTEVITMCNLFKITNPHHHNFIRYSNTEILVPGPFVIAAMISNTDRDFGDIVYEEFPVSTNINKVNIGDQLSSVTYVTSIEDIGPGLEEITVKHIGIKNFDMELLDNVAIPKSLFEGANIRPKEYEALCEKECQLLYGKIACQATRKIIRMKNE